MNKPSTDDPIQRLVRRHLIIGWAGLLLFLSLGIVLETLHGLKLDFYLDLRNEARRLMWTLAHSHGTLFSIISIAFALTLTVRRDWRPGGLRFVSWMLVGATIFLPTGFFLGGLWLTGSEPGLGVFLAPVGALMLLLAVGGMLLQLWSRENPIGSNDPGAAAKKSVKSGSGRRRS